MLGNLAEQQKGKHYRTKFIHKPDNFANSKVLLTSIRFFWFADGETRKCVQKHTWKGEKGK